jgi:hypothetical protein
MKSCLLVRGVLERDLPLTIPDGYHRICASYWLDEKADIPCRLVGSAWRRVPKLQESSSPPPPVA